MSDHHDVGTISNLEELFLSREFGHSEEIDSPTWIDELWLGAAYDPEAHLDPGPLEEVFLSRDFGRPMAEDDEETTADLDGPGATVLAFTPRDASARQRAVASLSGVAAAVLVVAGVAGGSGHSNPPGVPQAQAQAQAPAAAGPGSGSASAPGAPSVSPGSTPTVAADDQVSPRVCPDQSHVARSAGIGRRSSGQHRHRRTDDARHRDGWCAEPHSPPDPGATTLDEHRSPRRRRRGRRQHRGDGGNDGLHDGQPGGCRRPGGGVPHRRPRGRRGHRFGPRRDARVDLGLKGSALTAKIGAYFLLLYRDF